MGRRRNVEEMTNITANASTYEKKAMQVHCPTCNASLKIRKENTLLRCPVCDGLFVSRLRTRYASNTQSASQPKDVKANMRRNKIIKKSVSYFFLCLFSVVMIFPVYCLLIRSFMSDTESSTNALWPSSFSMKAYLAFFDEYNLWYLKNTLFICVMNILGVCIMASLTAYGLAKVDCGCNKLIFTLILSTVLLPAMVTAIPQYIIYEKINWNNSLYPLWLPIWFGGGAMNIFLIRQFIRGIPNSLCEAATLDGANSFTIYCRIILPLIKPILIYLAVTNFNATWNDFEGPMSFISNNQQFWTLSLALYRRSTSVSNPMFVNQQMAIGVIMMIPGVLTFAFFQKELMEGVAMTGLKG